MSFAPFDPLQFKNTKINDAALSAVKREIENILSSYVGWYDPFCELIQNALDAVEARSALEKAAGTELSYQPKLDIRLNLDENSLVVTDNRIGLDKDKFEQFLAPNFSFKSGNTRGHKGVGATYVAYGFNYMRISTKAPGFTASGRIIGARNWVRENASGANPKVEPDASPHSDSTFDLIDRGVSITVRFDENTHPKRLDWIKANSASNWMKILTIKTGLGSIVNDSRIEVSVTVISRAKTTAHVKNGISYLWLHDFSAKTASFNSISETQESLFKKYGASRKLPDRYMNLDFIYESWNASQLKALLASKLDNEEIAIIERHAPSVSVEFGYTANLWKQFNDSLGGLSRCPRLFYM